MATDPLPTADAGSSEQRAWGSSKGEGTLGRPQGPDPLRTVGLPGPAPLGHRLRLEEFASIYRRTGQQKPQF